MFRLYLFNGFIMFPRHKLNCFTRISNSCSRFKYQSLRQFSADTEEHSKIVNYPPILDVSPAAVKKREREAVHEKYRKLNTVEEKLFALNFPRYWGWESVILKEGELPYNVLPFAKYVTRTRFTELADVPTKSCVPHVDLKDFVNVIKSQIQEAILFQRRQRFESEATSGDDDSIQVKDLKLKSLLNQINRILIVNLSNYAPHLIDVEVDYNPRLEAFWSVGGFKRSEEEHRVRTEKLERDDVPWEWKQEEGYDLEHWFQYFGDALLHLRSTLPLEKISDSVEMSNDELSKLNSIESRYSPEFHGFEKKRRFGTTVPGFWPGKSVNEFGLLSFHSCNHLLGRPPHFGLEENNCAVHAQAILAGYAWLHGQASYQGFSTFNDITYPLVSQSVITDGQNFSFYAYQLNTMLMHKDAFESNKKCNICYGTPRLKLYENIQGNEFIGWNDDVVLKLVSAYLNRPSERDYNMKPYVNADERYISEIKDIDERRVWLHNQFRHMYSNRPRHKLPYEIFDWEWIFKIKFMMRQMEPRRRPFECWQHPLSERKYSDYLPPYIPKRMRDPKNPKNKYYGTFFPDC